MTIPQASHHIIQLPTTPSLSNPDQFNPHSIAREWLSNLESYLTGSTNSIPLSDLFHEDSWWRDMLVMEWDFHTIHGIQRIEDFITRNQPRVQLDGFTLQDESVKPKIESPVSGLTWLTAMFGFKCRFGSGNGVFYLTQENEGGKWKAYSVYVALQELERSRERLGVLRPEGTDVSKDTWTERRKAEVEFENGDDPAVFIIGAGQSGLNLAARLKAMGLSCLIVEKNERTGDNWRKRYRTLVTHDHAETCHMAYLPFPKTWPKYSPKDKLADWLEAYASVMELNIWLKSEIKAARFDQSAMRWTVSILRDGVERVLYPNHVVWCAGHLALPKIPTFLGQSGFNGPIYHGSEHVNAGLHSPAGKNVVIVGTGNSGHDIAQDFYEHGARVTMLQRGGTYVLTERHGLPLLPENIGIEDDSIPLEQADVLSESLPWPVTLALCVDLTKRISAADKATLEGLKKAGFKLNFGIDGAGIIRLIVDRGGGYYIDFGCSQLIIDGKIKVKYCPEGIAGFSQQYMLLNDGSRLPADIVVFATGYDNMRESVRRCLGDSIADRCNDIWGLDEEGEIKTIWRPSGHPNFWFMGGSLSLCRVYSRFVALQIGAAELGLTQ